ncbi:3-isopropylmalate dehydratase small subunit [Pseudorhodoplanes sp.]|uniref:3-isopropylmalate dehydratase small subunit n=1 Tax=Pseudorhodoplanes sp. TaxID=1934341 RepID=UPI003D0D31CF
MTRKFTMVTGPAAPLLLDDVNTDLIIPIEHCVSTPRAKFGSIAFEAIRFRPDGSENPDFVLNRKPYRGSPILIAGSNFGCGSSREPAVVALDQMGIRAIIARSFGEIFFANCLRNGLLPIALPPVPYDNLIALLRGEQPVILTVDLERCAIVAPDGATIPFEIDPSRRQALLEGLDQLGQTLLSLDDIAAFQQQDRIKRPWVWEAVFERQSNDPLVPAKSRTRREEPGFPLSRE